MGSHQVLGIGLLGASRVATYAIIEPARARTDVQVTAVASRDRARAQEFAAVHGIPSSTGDYRDVIDSDEVDLVYVGLPPSLHQEWTIRALEAGRAVLCEKPFALNAHEARAMTAASAACGRPLLEAFHYRFHATIHRTLAIVRDQLGPLRSMHAVVAGPGPKDRNDIRWQSGLGGGALMDLGCYAVHALRTLASCEPVIDGARMMMDGGVDAATSANLRFDSCPEARMECAFLASRFTNSLRIVGERGTLEVEGFMLPQFGGRIRLTQDGLAREESLPPGTTFAAQLDHVVDVLAGRAEPLTGGKDAVANMLALDAIRTACTARS